LKEGLEPLVDGFMNFQTQSRKCEYRTRFRIEIRQTPLSSAHARRNHWSVVSSGV